MVPHEKPRHLARRCAARTGTTLAESNLRTTSDRTEPAISRDGHKKATNLVGAVLYASPHKGGRSHNGTGQVIGRHTVIAARLPSGLRRKLCAAKLCIVALSTKAAN